MPWRWILVALVLATAVYGTFVVVLIARGRRSDARALAGVIPDCLVLLRRLVGDPRVPRSRKALLGGLIVYLAMPFDLVPDFIPVAGQLDDAVITAIVLRSVLRAGGAELVREHWPGPASSRDLLLRLAFARRSPAKAGRLGARL